MTILGVSDTELNCEAYPKGIRKRYMETSNHQPTQALKALNGHCLAYDYAKARVRRLYTLETATFLKALKRGKEQTPRIDAFSGSLKGFFADFDSLESLSNHIPASYSSSWDAAYEFLSGKFKNGCVFKSYTGKVKIFFPLDIQTISVISARNLAKKILGDIFDAIDSKGGLRYSFINETAYTKIKEYVSSSSLNKDIQFNSQYIRKGFRNGEEVRSIIKPKSDISWNLYDGELPENIQNLKRGKTVQFVFKYMAGALYLSSEAGIALPQVNMAKIAGVSQMAISKAIHKAMELGIIRRVSYAHYDSGTAAKYKFDGFYLQWAKAELARIKKGKPALNREEKLRAILSEIQDHNWNLPLFKLTGLFTSEETYLEAVESIPGVHDKPERLRQALNAWKCHSRNLNKIKHLSAMKTA